MHHEIWSEEFFSKFYAGIFSDCLNNIYTSVSEDDSSLDYSSDSYDVNIRPTKRQKTLRLVLKGKEKMKLTVLENAPGLLYKS